MTASVRYSATVVRNERLPLKARPRSAASLVGGGGIEAGRRGCHSKRFCCVEQHVEGLVGKKEADLKRVFRINSNHHRGCGRDVGQLDSGMWRMKSTMSCFHQRKH